MADFSKAGSIIDEWAVTAAASQRLGDPAVIPDDIEMALIVDICKVEAVAHDGECSIIFECSPVASGNENWVELMTSKINAETAATTTLDVEAAATDTLIPILATANFTTKGDRYLIKNGTIANSEIVRNNGYSDGVSITILQGLTNTQQNGVSIFTTVETFVLGMPSWAMRARAIILNLDADCDVMSLTRLGRVTDLV